MLVISHARGCGALRGSAFLALLLLAWTAAADDRVALSGDARRLSLSANDATLRQVLEAIADHDLLSVESALPLQQPVSIELRDMALDTLIRRLLRHHNYVLIAHDARTMPRLVIRARGGVSADVSWRSDGDAHAFDAAVAELTHPDADVREEAVLTLADIDDVAAVPYLVGMLGDTSADVRDTVEAVLEDLQDADRLSSQSAADGDRRR